MSDDKKRDRALQRRVRERQAKTGESYQAAWRSLTGSAAPPAEGELSGRVAEPDGQRRSTRGGPGAHSSAPALV